MKQLMLAAVLLAGLAAPASSCDVIAGPGAVVRYSEGKSGGTATVGCVFQNNGNPWEIRAWWVGEQKIYDELITIDQFPAISVSKLWIFRQGSKFQPVLSVGLMLKPSQRCHFDGDLDCNRQVPLAFCFLPSAGIKWGDVYISAFHCSNASLDWGPEKKNLGLDGLRADLWLDWH